MDIVYFVKPDRTKVRVSRPMPWGEAIDRWNKVYEHPSAGKGYYAVRSASDPDWPAKGDYRQAHDLKTGRFV